MYRMLVAILCVLLCLTKGAAEADRAVSLPGLVLTGGALDSIRVAAGAKVEVVYETGARGAMRGVVQAVDWEQRQLVLVLERKGEIETLEVDRIQTLKMMDAGNAAGSAMLDRPAESKDNMSAGKRVALKLVAGTIGSLMGVSIGSPYAELGNDAPFYGLEPIVFGCLVGTTMGVNTFGPRDRSMRFFIRSLGVSFGGSVVGLIGGMGLTLANPDVFWPSLLVVPVVGATLASELWHKPPAIVSIGLEPNLNHSLSAVARLRF